MQESAVTLNQFYGIRREYRPYYKLNHQYLRRGWDHLRCADCDFFSRKMAMKSITEDDRESTERNFKGHLHKQAAFRECYYATRAKQASKLRNISAISDGAGSTGLIHCPRPTRMSKSMHARHEMCKIKSTLTKTHGNGITIDINFPNCEKMGTNLTIDIMLKTIEDYLEDKSLESLDNVYFQFDNVNSNKGLLIFGVCSALIMSGIVRKFKISYLMVGHTHDDVDANIGECATALRPEDVYSLTNMKEYLEEAFKSRKFKLRVNIGVANFEALLPLIKDCLSCSEMPVAKMRQVLSFSNCHFDCLNFRCCCCCCRCE
jgi:hypothetical protein